MPASRPTFPSETQPRRLGVGGGPGGGDRVVRAQMVIALVLGFMVLAVLLYLLRRPGAMPHPEQDAGASASAGSSASAPVIVRTKIEPPREVVPKVKLGAVSHVKCGSSPRQIADTVCDSLPPIEQSLSQAILDTVSCAPKVGEAGSINYVVAIDFRTRDLRVYPGRSGSFRGKQARKAADCVRQAMKAPAWESMAHQYRYYVMAQLATYPSENAVEGIPDFK